MSAKSKIVQVIETISRNKDGTSHYQLFNQKWEALLDSDWTIIVWESLQSRVTNLAKDFNKSRSDNEEQINMDWLKMLTDWIDEQNKPVNPKKETAKK